MKTPEQMAEEYIRYENESAYWTKHAFLAGYEAAKDQLADADKVITYDYVETASKHAEELIGEFELSGNKDMLVKALVAAYCSGIDAVDGHLRNSLSAYRTSVRRQQWISVKERLPKEDECVLIYQSKAGCWVSSHDKHGWGMWENGLTCEPTHWMSLPELPKEEA